MAPSRSSSKAFITHCEFGGFQLDHFLMVPTAPSLYKRVTLTYHAETALSGHQVYFKIKIATSHNSAKNSEPIIILGILQTTVSSLI